MPLKLGELVAIDGAGGGDSTHKEIKKVEFQQT